MIRILGLDDHPELVVGQWRDSGLDNLALFTASESITAYEQAIEEIELHQPDVVILDYFMGSLTGDSLIPEIEDRWPDIKIFGNSSVEGKFIGLVNLDKDPSKLFDAMVPLIRLDRELSEKE